MDDRACVVLGSTTTNTRMLRNMSLIPTLDYSTTDLRLRFLHAR